MSKAVRYSPFEIAKALSEVDKAVREPTQEQALIISAPLEPAVVIAGAGSGKTETMSARVLYLVANEIVRPDEILGLTFTRKAAGELNLRIRKRLRQLRSSGLIPKNSGVDATVMTYHSYAGRLLGEHSIRSGIDAGDQPMGDAAIWQMASDLVTNWSDPNFTSQSALSTVIKDVIGLTRLVLEHQTSLADIESASTVILEQIDQLELRGSHSNEEVRKVQLVLNQRLSLLPMVEEFISKRRRDGQLSFDDQMAIAADISMKFSDVGVIERSRYRVVLLDEYQDTSQSQVRALSALFGNGHPVTAVGDPCQAIYTWRGASAGTIGAFAKHFPKLQSQKGAAQYSLSTTFRNDEVILNLANEVSIAIREESPVPVAPLMARKRAGKGELACGIFENMEIEANAISEYFSNLWNEPSRLAMQEDRRSSFAVLVRKRSQIPDIESALRTAGLPVEVLGVGGLVHVAEVADVVSLMRVITDPDAGAALMRHLTGPRINLGAADIAALGRYAKSLAASLHANSRGLIAKISAGNPLQEEADDQFAGSLIDALDEIAQANRADFSPVGFSRLVQFAADLRRLRSRAGGSLIDLITEIENYLFLDTEIALRDGYQNGRRHLDRFIDEALKFSRSNGSISQFLIWLDIAASEESGLKSGSPEVRRDVVQILTIHNSKGAEWDVVAVPGLAEGTFPSSGRERANWLTDEKQIPFHLRGDGDELPVLDISQCTTNAEVSKEFKGFSSKCDAFRMAEEIRLGYVAFTRAKSHLLCTTSHWREAIKPVRPSSLYMSALSLAFVQGGIILSDAPAPDEGERNPQEANPLTGTWPRDPLGNKRANFNSEIDLVKTSAAHNLIDDADTEVQSWISDARALIQELHQGKSKAPVFLPPRLSVSTLISLRENPDELALAIRRPMPRVQDEYSRRGTVFHEWVESQFGQGTLFDDEDLDSVDPLEEDQTLAQLKEAWLLSEWASLQPYAIEVPFETVLAGVLVRGRIDAVYKFGDRFEVVDWKTGSKKLGESAAIQLAMYRLAWAKLNSIPLEAISAAFHHVPTGVTDRPADLLGESELIALIEKFQ
jgi:DNA helicase-2/ATP-dependent DNA helicase PcrA